MEDLDFLTTDFTEFDKYIIGFTENQYSKSNNRSPSPIDHTPRHSSLAIGYAERSNKIAENIFQDFSSVLDRQKTRSVNKINGNKLDLVFELTKRRKNSNNTLQRSLNSDPRLDSPRSTTSSEEMEEIPGATTPTYPILEVQQLPPHSKHVYCMPLLPDIHVEPVNLVQKTKKKKKTTAGNKSNSNPKSEQSPDAFKAPKLYNVVNQARTKLQHDKRIASESAKTNDNTKENAVTINDTKLPATIGANTSERITDDRVKKTVKWQKVTNKLVDAMKQVGEHPAEFSVYKRRNSIIRSFDGEFRKSSFCQSSYQERSDRERSYNIRRRHSLQTKTGPLDFSKLRRQIFGRSNTMMW